MHQINNFWFENIESNGSSNEIFNSGKETDIQLGKYIPKTP